MTVGVLYCADASLYGAVMQCSSGLAPSSLVVLPMNRTYTNQVPDANIMDHVPMVNIMPPTVMLGNAPALDNLSKLMCTWGGLIQIATPGEITVNVP